MVEICKQSIVNLTGIVRVGVNWDGCGGFDCVFIFTHITTFTISPQAESCRSCHTYSPTKIRHQKNDTHVQTVV